MSSTDFGVARLAQSSALLNSHLSQGLKSVCDKRSLPSFKWITTSTDYLMYRWHLKYHYIIHQVKNTISRKILANSDTYSTVPLAYKLWTFRRPSYTVSLRWNLCGFGWTSKITVWNVNLSDNLAALKEFRNGLSGKESLSQLMFSSNILRGKDAGEHFLATFFNTSLLTGCSYWWIIWLLIG